MTEELKGDFAALATSLKDSLGGRIATLEEQAGELLSLKDGVEEIRERLKSREHHGVSYVEGAEDAFKTDDPAKRFNLHRGLVGWAFGFNYDKTPYGKDANKELWPERDILEAATTKAQSAGVDTEGGFAVPEQFNSEYIPILLAKTTAMQLGARFMTDFRGNPVVWPRIDTASQAYWVAENVAPTESEVELGQISMTPHDLAALVPISNRLQFQTSGGFESMLRDHMARIHAIKLDQAFYKGTGATGEPLGLANVSGIGTTSFSGVTKSGASQTLTDKLSEMVEDVDTANALEGSLGFVMHPQTAGYFREAKDADGKPLLMSGDYNDRAGMKRLYGYPALTTTQLAAGNPADLFFGNWSDGLVGQWGTLLVDTSNVAGNAFFRRQTYVRVVLTVDVAFMHEGSFSAATSFNAA